MLTSIAWSTNHIGRLIAVLGFLGLVLLCASVATYVMTTIDIAKLERDEALEKYNNLAEKNAGKR